MSTVRRAIEKAGKDLLKYPNVVGYSCELQKRIRKGQLVDEDVLRVYVSKKVPREQLKPDEVIPPEVGVEGVKLKTDVVEIGRLKKLSGFRERYRPAPCGVSTGRADVTDTGTIGWWVFDENGNLYMISNNHVWARENRGSSGDPLIQPGRVDGGDPERDVIAQLADFVPISWTGTNKVDVAIAQPLDYSIVYTSIMDVGGVTGKVLRNPGWVRKVGRTTGVTQGEVFDWSATLYVEFDTGTALFTDVIVVRGRDVIKPGDSGSPVLDFENRFAGLAFAGNEEGTVMVGCKATNIESELYSRTGRRFYSLIANSYPPFRVETKVQVVHPPAFWSLLMSLVTGLTIISVYDAIKAGVGEWRGE